MSKIHSIALPYFGEDELACPCCGQIALDIRFAARLPDLRDRWGQPLYPTSVCRCKRHNRQVGGHPRSLHLIDNPVHPTWGTMAADLSWADWRTGDRLTFAQLAWVSGFSVGLNPRFIHIDLRKLIGLQQTVFTYKGWREHDQFKPDEVRIP